MHGRHIAFFPLPGKSHVYAFLGLCTELVRRGNRVTIATDESYAKHVISAGAEPVIFERYRPTETASATKGLPANDPKRIDESASLVFHFLLNSAAIAVSELDSFYRNNRPDLIVYEFAAYAGLIFSKRLHSPAIQYYPDFIHASGHLCWEGGVGYNPRSIIEFARLLDSFLWAYGFDEIDNFWRSENLNIYRFPTEFQFDKNAADSRRFCFVGQFLNRPFSPVWKNRSGAKRIILVSAVQESLDADYFNIVSDALCDTDYHVILSVGESFPINELRTPPENVEINRCASHLEILPHASLHIYSGGPGGTLEGLFFGVPLIAIASLTHNYMIASRLSELGLALNLPLHSLTKDLIRDGVAAVLRDDALLSRVKQMQRVLRSSGGDVMAADRIEQFLSGRS